MSAASGGNSEPKQGQRSQSARGFAPEARCGYRNPTLSSILATQMPCRSCRSGAYAARRELCGVALRRAGVPSSPFILFTFISKRNCPPAYRAKRHIRGQFLLIRLFSGGVLRCHSLQIKSAPHPRWSRGHRSAAELPAFRHRWSGRQHTFLPLRQTGCHHPHTGCRSAPLP